MEEQKPQDLLPPQPGFWSDLFSYAKSSKKWWMIPLILVLVSVGLLTIFMTSSAAQAFIYTLF
jgi:hypothetical protein